jgi:uncharacterized LabA/DUF88 family protein
LSNTVRALAFSGSDNLFAGGVLPPPVAAAPAGLPDGTIKGNVDAELVLHSMIQYPNYSIAIIVSGDGDFYCLAEYLGQNNKLLHIITPNETYSHILSRFSGFIIRVDQLRGSLERT